MWDNIIVHIFSFMPIVLSKFLLMWKASGAKLIFFGQKKIISWKTSVKSECLFLFASWRMTVWFYLTLSDSQFWVSLLLCNCGIHKDVSARLFLSLNLTALYLKQASLNGFLVIGQLFQDSWHGKNLFWWCGKWLFCWLWNLF